MYGNGHTTSAAPDAPAFDLVVVAASLGGLAAISGLLRRLPTHFGASVVVVHHRTFDGPLPDILRKQTALTVSAMQHGQRLAPGSVFVAPARSQATFASDGSVIVDDACDMCRADQVMASAAAVYESRVVGVVMTGRLDDGAAGTRAIKANGGRVLAQDPTSCAADGMPLAAIATGCVDFVLPPASLADALVALVMAPGAADLFRVRLAPWAFRSTPSGLPASGSSAAAAG